MTTMTEQSVQVYAVFIRATEEQVWDAITKPEFTTKYFYGSVIDSTYEPGTPYTGWSTDRSPAIRASTASPGHSWRIPTAGSIPNRSGASCVPISVCSR